jgi:hypothetical protein
VKIRSKRPSVRRAPPPPPPEKCYASRFTCCMTTSP